MHSVGQQQAISQTGLPQRHTCVRSSVCVVRSCPSASASESTHSSPEPPRQTCRCQTRLPPGGHA
eukprot:147567-Chlamydomonas_euryale.AAC.2